MKTVNELIIGGKVALTQSEQIAVLETFKENLNEFPTVRSITWEFKQGNNGTPKRKQVKHLGETGATELIGKLGIWLSQFSDIQLEMALREYRRRKAMR